LGAFTDWAPINKEKPTLTLNQVLDRYVSPLSCPVVGGLIYGHFPVKISIPIGVKARLEVTNTGARLDVVEPLASDKA